MVVRISNFSSKLHIADKHKEILEKCKDIYRINSLNSSYDGMHFQIM